MKRVRGQKSVMKHDFSRIPAANIPRSTFDRSHGYKTTMDAGPLVPFFLEEVVPGDTHSVSAQIFGRLATPLHPLMDNMFLDSFYFFVPNRLVWESWQKFMGEQENPGDSTDFTIPILSGATAASVGSMPDYYGIPLGSGLAGRNISALPFRAYNLIYNEWFRSEDLQDSATVDTSSVEGSAWTTYYPIRSRGKRHDYFTSCLPWPQKGPGVDLPLGTTAPIFSEADTGEEIGVTKSQGGAVVEMNSSGATLLMTNTTPSPVGTGLQADLSEAQAATINDLRQAFQIQKLQERDARGGTRYQELILSHFGVRGGDARLQRPEYLGGGSTPVQVTQVPNTTSDDTGADPVPQGHLAGYGVVNGQSGFTKSFTEHGYIIGLLNVRADLTYQKGLDRHWSRSTKYDFYFPALAKIGEQAVLNKEIYMEGVAEDDSVFGYQERWSEMRYKNSQITGLFRSDAPGSLDPWHLSEDFGSLPVLGDTFITSKPPVDRVIAVPSEPHFLIDSYIRLRSVRPMPVNSAPGYIDHF